MPQIKILIYFNTAFLTVIWNIPINLLGLDLVLAAQFPGIVSSEERIKLDFMNIDTLCD